ncbi:MAG TPA: hypothetical protein VMS81_07805, partial [Methanomicrobiales archaeon]|nr:hypothetical protein [Methanomicrobiales archaeon]
MKQIHFILCATLAVFCLVQACAALTSSGITTNPSQVNALRPGDVISEVSGTVNLPTSGDMTF